MDEIRIILQGIRIDHKLEIHDGITLTPLPNSTEQPASISPGLPTIITEEPTSYLGKVLLSKTKSNVNFSSDVSSTFVMICNNAVHPVKSGFSLKQVTHLGFCA